LRQATVLVGAASQRRTKTASTVALAVVRGATAEMPGKAPARRRVGAFRCDCLARHIVLLSFAL